MLRSIEKEVQMLNDSLALAAVMPLPSPITTDPLQDKAYIENLPITIPFIDDIDNEFRWVIKYINQHDAKELVGKKLSRKKSHSITGETVKLKHRFVFMLNRHKKVIPYIISDILLGQGSEGKIRISRKCFFDEVGSYNGYGVFAMKIIKLSDDQQMLKFQLNRITFEIRCLNTVNQLDCAVDRTDGVRKVYISMIYFPGGQLASADREREKALAEMMIKAGITNEDGSIKKGVTNYVQLVDYVRTEIRPDLFYAKLRYEVDTAIAAMQLAKQFTWLHAHNIAHLDIKAENIMYDPKTKSFMVIDFGLALPMGASMSCRGTLYYIAPEVAALRDPSLSLKVTGKPDVYSLGVVFQKILQLDKNDEYLYNLE